jgi:hypothetical protein
MATPADTDVADVARHLTVRKTFLECVEDDDDDFLEAEFGMPRAVSEPAGHVVPPDPARSWRPSLSGFKSELGAPTSYGLFQALGEVGAVCTDAVSNGPIAGHSAKGADFKPEEPLYIREASQPSTQDNLRTEPQAPASTSRGQIGHPDSCTECQFFFFSPDGCRSGEDCLYCHAMHPRKNPKKNRRHLKRFNPGTASVETVQESTFCESSSSATPAPARIVKTTTTSSKSSSVVRSSSLGAKISMDKRLASPPLNESLDALDPTAVRGEAPPGLSAIRGDSPNISLSYLPGPISDTSAAQSLIFIAGVRIRIEPRMDTGTSQWQSLKDRIIFNVSPPLPPGLSLHPHFGYITGLLPGLQHKEPSMHTVSISIALVGQGGILCGAWPLTRRNITVQVVDLKEYVLTEAQQELGEVDGKQLVLKFKES